MSQYWFKDSVATFAGVVLQNRDLNLQRFELKCKRIIIIVSKKATPVEF